MISHYSGDCCGTTFTPRALLGRGNLTSASFASGDTQAGNEVAAQLPRWWHQIKTRTAHIPQSFGLTTVQDLSASECNVLDVLEDRQSIPSAFDHIRRGSHLTQGSDCIRDADSRSLSGYETVNSHTPVG